MGSIVKKSILVLCFAFIAWFSAVPILKTLLKLPSPVLPVFSPDASKESLAHSRTPINRISPWMQLAVLAAEDHRYYEHHGIDSLGILRATIDNVRAGKMIEGASTITQQLAKITFLNQDEKTAKRKLRQMVLAWELEEEYSKERILEAYLNTVYFGRGAYGIENAAQEYFGVHASQLSIAQSAFLAGLIKAPSYLGNKAHLKEAIARQRQVIENMQECAFITNQQAKHAVSQTARLSRTEQHDSKRGSFRQ